MRAPANRLMLPTGAKLGRCGSTRATAPRTVRPEAKGLAVSFCIDCSLSFNYLSSRPPGGGLVWLPQSLGGAGNVAGPAAPDEQGVTQTVQVSDSLRRHAFGAAQRDHDALGAAAHGAADVEFGIQAAGAGQDEGAQRRHVFIHDVHLRFESGDFGIGDARLARMYVLGKGGENRAQVEELVLHAQENGSQYGEARLLHGERGDGSARGSQETVEFIDRAVGFDARSILGDALAADERGLAGVALAGVDAIDGEARLVKRLFGHGYLRSLWGRLATCAAVVYRRRTAANAAVGRLTIGRSLPSCPTKGALVNL